jgi:flagellar motor component MotA
MNIEIEKKQKRRISNSFFNALATSKRYILIVIIEVALFFLYYYIVSPSNFSSFSDTLRYFISALGTLLAVVVSFNTLALQNQLKNMPTNISSLNKQLDEIEDILKPVLDKSRDNIQKTYHKL